MGNIREIGARQEEDLIVVTRLLPDSINDLLHGDTPSVHIQVVRLIHEPEEDVVFIAVLLGKLSPCEAVLSKVHHGSTAYNAPHLSQGQVWQASPPPTLRCQRKSE